MRESEDATIEEDTLKEFYKSIKGKSDKILQQNYRELKKFQMPLNQLIEVAQTCKSFRREDTELVENCQQDILKIGRFWKQLLRRGEKKCFAFIKKLTKNGNSHFFTSLNQQNLEPDGPNDWSISKCHIQRCCSYVVQEIQLSTDIVDKLFMYSVITIDEHDKIEELRVRREQRNEIIRILLDKPGSDWISGFLHVLSLTGHNRIITRLREDPRDAGSTIHLSRRTSPLGHTQPIPQRNFEIRLEGSQANTAQFHAVVSRSSEMRDTFQQLLDSNIVELREACIYIHLTTDSPNALCDIIEGRGNDKMKCCMQTLFQKNRHLIDYFGNDKVIKVFIRELPMQGFITGDKDTGYVGDNCKECYQATIRENYEQILDEIEDDIIDETLKKLFEMRKEQNVVMKNKECFLEMDSRHEKAVRFLQYVLCNKDVLMAFKVVFKAKSKLILEKKLCSTCSGIGGNIQKNQPTKAVLYYKVSLNKNGTAKVSEVSKAEYKTEQEVIEDDNIHH